MIGRPPRSTLFPYPPLFRSLPDCCHCRFHAAAAAGTAGAAGEVRGAAENEGPSFSPASRSQDRSARGGSAQRIAELFGAATRSEEHTSELQSRLHLVCRLLL